MPMKFYPVNLLIIGLILLPNILAAGFPPVNIPVQAKRPPWWIIIIALEWIGRIGIFILPLFWQFSLDRNKLIFLIPMGLMIAIYYMGWIRFFANGSEFRLLFEPLFKIPIPLALSPVLCIFFMGLAQNSWPVVAAAIIMALGHIPESIRNYQSIR
ncbi:MAG: hypothetical protein R6W99_05560 [Clostridia bacterium]